MASPTPPADQAWPHALDRRLVKRLWQRAERPGCIRHSQARDIVSRHSRMTGGPPLAGLLQRRASVAAGPWAGQPPIVTARPTAAAPGPPPPQAIGEGAARRPAARAKPAPAPGAATVPPTSPRPAAPGLTPSRRGVRGLVQHSSAAQATAPPATATKSAATWPAAANGQSAHAAVQVTRVPMPATPPTPASAASGGPPGPAGGGLPGPVRDGVPGLTGGGLPGSQLSAGPHQPGARPGVTAAAPITGNAPGPRSTPPEAPAGAPRRPVVRAGEGGDRANALSTVGALPLPASREAGRPARPAVRERASGTGASAFALPKLFEQALLPLAHAAAAERPSARLTSTVAATSGRSHPAGPAATPGTGEAGQAQPVGRRAERDDREPGRSRSAPSPADLDRIIGTVQRRLMHQFAIERERRGMGR
jgi:hypothetical protein